MLGLGTVERVTVQDGEELKCLGYVYVLQGCSTAMSTDLWQVFGRMLVLVQLFVTELWGMCGLVMWYLSSFSLFSGGQCVEGSVRGYNDVSMHIAFITMVPSQRSMGQCFSACILSTAE